MFLGQAAPFGIPTEVVPSRLKALALPSKPTAQSSQKVISKELRLNERGSYFEGFTHFSKYIGNSQLFSLHTAAL